MRFACIPGALALLLSGAAPAVSPAPASATATPVVSCEFYAWSTDRDPAGLRVRAGPSAKATVIGRLPPAIVPRDDSEYAPVFKVTGAKDGWLRITDANDNYNPGTPRATYNGTGWVHGSMVRVAVQGPNGRVAPARTARLLVSTGKDWLTDRAYVTGITSCSGKWAKVRYVFRKAPPHGPRAGEAWFTNICGEQRTTCDGVVGSDP